MGMFSGKQTKGALANKREQKRIDAELRQEEFSKAVADEMHRNPEMTLPHAKGIVAVRLRQQREVAKMGAEELLTEIFAK